MKKNQTLHNRRDFLKIIGASSLGAALAPSMLSWAKESEKISATVAIVKNPSIGQAVKDAVAMSGGLDFIKPGQTVLIKPNQVAPAKHPITTNPEVLYEIIKLVAETGCEKIYVSDQGFHTFTDGKALMRNSGHFDAAKQAEYDCKGKLKVIPVTFEDAGPYLTGFSQRWRKITPPLAQRWTENNTRVPFEMAELLFQADHVINVPACKCHTQLWFTLSMKNFVGMISHNSRSYFHSHAASGNFYKSGDSQPWTATEADVTPVAQYIAELSLALKPSLNIIDGTQPLYAGSHVSGESVKADTIIASRDRIAADVAGVALLRILGGEKRLHSMSPWKHPLIRHARKLKIGVKRRSNLTVKHKGLENTSEYLEQMT